MISVESAISFTSKVKKEHLQNEDHPVFIQ
jgi:hypothetical protein